VISENRQSPTHQIAKSLNRQEAVMPPAAQPRIALLPQSEWTPEVLEILDATQMGGRVLNIFKTLARHPKLLKRWLVFGNHVLFKSTIGARERELLILRTGWNCRAEYEWGQHVVIGKAVGLTDEEIERITRGPDAAGWDPFDAALLRAADELHRDSRIGDATWQALRARYDDQQLLDVIFAVGQYTLVSMVLNSCGVELDEGISGFPKR
jgi:alkylhydroperoxidase family enzyme